MDKCREEFEKWLNETKAGYSWKKTEPGYTHEYSDPYVNLMWKAWKASRENMKAVKLPTKYRAVIDNESFFFNEAVDLCKDAITSAGYKVE